MSLADVHGRLPTSGELDARIGARVETVPVDGEVARGLLKSFWKALAETATFLPERALALDGTGAVAVALDPTVYDLSYSDVDRFFRMRFLGPEAGEAVACSDETPILRWVLELERRFESMKRVQTDK